MNALPSSRKSSFVERLYLVQALRVSMEEQRQRQEEEARRAAAQSAVEAGVTPSAVTEEPEG